jgi:hypothetical protein
MTHWSDIYPHELHANVLLLDNKIECWKVGNTKAEEYWPFKAYWKLDRLNDYEVKSHTWVVNNDEEHNEVFRTLSKEWFRQWEHADDYKLQRAY